MNIPKLLSQETSISSLNVKQPQTSFLFRQTNRFPSNKSWLLPQDIATPKEVSTQTCNLMDNNKGQRNDVDLKLDHPMNNRLKEF
jgi:hypothetical protein